MVIEQNAETKKVKIEIKLVIEVRPYGDVDPCKLAESWIDDCAGEVGTVFRPAFSESLRGEVEVKRVKVER